jgi:hypothetical protein
MKLWKGFTLADHRNGRRYEVWNPVGYGLASLFDQKRPSLNFV